MMKFREKNLINCHYYIKPDSYLKLSHQHYYTITPDIIVELLQGGHKTFIFDNKLCIQVDFENESINGFKKICYFAIFDDLAMLELDSYQWFERFHNKSLLITHPIYEYKNTYYFFNPNTCKAECIQHREKLVEELVNEGAYTIGDGIIMALSLVAKKVLEEKVVLTWLKRISHGSRIYHTLSNDWFIYIQNNPYQLMDHLFKYAFVFNSQNIYQYIHKISYEDMFVYHLGQRYVTTVFNLATRKDQLRYIEPYKYLYQPRYRGNTRILIKPNLFNHFKFKDFNLIKDILEYTQVDSRYSIFVLTLSYHNNNHYRNLWRFLIKYFYHNTWNDHLLTYFKMLIDYSYDSYIKDLCIPIKMFRDTVYLTSFNYTLEWKNTLEKVDYMCKTSYKRIFDRKIIQRLKYLTHITQEHPNAYVLEELMKTYYRENKQDLVI